MEKQANQEGRSHPGCVYCYIIIDSWEESRSRKRGSSSISNTVYFIGCIYVTPLILSHLPRDLIWVLEKTVNPDFRLV